MCVCVWCVCVCACVRACREWEGEKERALAAAAARRRLTCAQRLSLLSKLASDSAASAAQPTADGLFLPYTWPDALGRGVCVCVRVFVCPSSGLCVYCCCFVPAAASWCVVAARRGGGAKEGAAEE